MFYRLALALCLVFMLGCSSYKGPDDYIVPIEINKTTFTSMAYLNSEIVVYLNDELTPKQKEVVIDSLKYQLKEFEADWGAPSKKVTVFMFNTKLIPCGNRKGDFVGCHYGPTGPIHLAQTKYYSGGPFYHELVHRNISGNDHEHKDPRWRYIWQPARYRIVEELEARNKVLLNN